MKFAPILDSQTSNVASVCPRSAKKQRTALLTSEESKRKIRAYLRSAAQLFPVKWVAQIINGAVARQQYPETIPASQPPHLADHNRNFGTV